MSAKSLSHGIKREWQRWISLSHGKRHKLKILTPSRLFSLLSPDATTSQFTLPKKQKFTVTGCAATLRHPHRLEPAPAALPHCAPCSGHDERHCRFFKPLTRGVVGASSALVLCSGSIEVRHRTTCCFEPRAQEAKSDFELRCVISTTTKISVYQHDRATSHVTIWSTATDSCLMPLYFQLHQFP
jgi:hypothetical protein